jgi:hypothetical protein
MSFESIEFQQPVDNSPEPPVSVAVVHCVSIAPFADSEHSHTLPQFKAELAKVLEINFYEAAAEGQVDLVRHLLNGYDMRKYAGHAAERAGYENHWPLAIALLNYSGADLKTKNFLLASALRLRNYDMTRNLLIMGADASSSPQIGGMMACLAANRPSDPAPFIDLLIQGGAMKLYEGEEGSRQAAMAMNAAATNGDIRVLTLFTGSGFKDVGPHEIISFHHDLPWISRCNFNGVLAKAAQYCAKTGETLILGEALKTGAEQDKEFAVVSAVFLLLRHGNHAHQSYLFRVVLFLINNGFIGPNGWTVPTECHINMMRECIPQAPEILDILARSWDIHDKDILSDLLYRAIINLDISSVLLLISYGADVNAPCLCFFNNKPLITLVLRIGEWKIKGPKDTAAIALVLLNAGASVLHSKDAKGRTALDIETGPDGKNDIQLVSYLQEYLQKEIEAQEEEQAGEQA